MRLSHEILPEPTEVGDLTLRRATDSDASDLIRLVVGGSDDHGRRDVEERSFEVRRAVRDDRVLIATDMTGEAVAAIGLTVQSRHGGHSVEGVVTVMGTGGQDLSDDLVASFEVLSERMAELGCTCLSLNVPTRDLAVASNGVGHLGFEVVPASGSSPDVTLSVATRSFEHAREMSAPRM